MSDDTPHSQEHEVDHDLRRRVVWGIASGASNEVVAQNEGLTADELRTVMASPGMFLLLKIWSIFFKEGDKGDIPLLTRLVQWALDFILCHARERAVGVGIGYSFIAGLYLKVSFKGTLKALCDHIEGVIGLQTRKPLRGMRGKLVSVLCWVIESALTQLLIDQFGEEYLASQCELFAEAAINGTLPDRIFDGEPTEESDAVEALAASDEIPAAGTLSSPGEPGMRGSGPLMTRGAVSGLAVSTRSSSTTRTRPRLVHSVDDVEPVVRPPPARILLDETVRFKRRRSPSPRLVRRMPIERAA